MQSIGIIGTGIAGLGAAYFLRNKYAITLFEKNDYPGGHTNTLTIEENSKPVHIDSAFMVFNDRTYPNLIKLFEELNVKVKNTDMSFSVQHLPTKLEYCGTGLNGLFSQRKNIVNCRFWKMLLEMNKFNQEAPKIIDDDRYKSYTLMEYVKENGYSDDFIYQFIIPISSAVWSTPPDQMLNFPAVTLVTFFKNHGFLGLKGHYQWKTCVEGSQRYRDKILKYFEGNIHLNCAIQQVFKRDGKAIVIDDQKNEYQFDKVILASHADQTLKMLKEPEILETELLSCFKYQKNRTILHTDESIMPKTQLAWSSWNYRIKDSLPSTIYWMNNLQHVSKNKNYFISINDANEVKEDKILWQKDYEHPLFDVKAIEAQERLAELNQNGVIYFCGSYFKYGFHEDALTSGLNVAKAIAGENIWN